MSYSLSAVVCVLAIAGFSWLTGQAAQAKLGLLDGESDPGANLLSFMVGFGLLICVLFVLAAAQLLRPLPVGAALVLVTVISLAYLRKTAGGWRNILGPKSGRPRPVSILLVSGLLVLLSLRAFAPALEWDELAYHLPVAREFARSSGLTVFENLRYPLNAWNLHLVWAGALMFGSEATPHLVNACLAVLVTLGIYRFGRNASGKASGIIAALIFLYFARDLANTAYVGMALTAFVFFAFQAFVSWQKTRREGYLLIGAFLLAMATGVKYHGLLYLPVFALALACLGGRWSAFFKAGLVLALFGGWWYLRNAWIAGDPLHPLGGVVFGFWAWNADDLAAQHADVARYGHHLPLVLAPALVFVFLDGRRRPENMALMVMAYGGLALWYFTSRYDRYLMATIPFLAILSARVLVAVAQRLSARVWTAGRPRGANERWSRPLETTAFALLLLVGVAIGFREWEKACFSEACVERVYARELLSWPVVRSVAGFEDLRLYQYGLENELYVLGDNAAGDWFGPYRYARIKASSGDPLALRGVLLDMGRDSILVNRVRAGFDGIPQTEVLVGEFELLYEDGRVSLYRIAR